jgi:hypothetical protein
MPEYEFIFESLPLREPPQIPQEWVTMLCKLHPLTAAVVWQVLTDKINPSTITLAQSSPDRGRYMLIDLIANGSVDTCDELTKIAREEIDEIFDTVMPGYNARKLLQ